MGLYLCCIFFELQWNRVLNEVVAKKWVAYFFSTSQDAFYVPVIGKRLKLWQRSESCGRSCGQNLSQLIEIVAVFWAGLWKYVDFIVTRRVDRRFNSDFCHDFAFENRKLKSIDNMYWLLCIKCSIINKVITFRTFAGSIKKMHLSALTCF